jgi:hypothetical protein
VIVKFWDGLLAYKPRGARVVGGRWFYLGFTVGERTEVFPAQGKAYLLTSTKGHGLWDGTVTGTVGGQSA